MTTTPHPGPARACGGRGASKPSPTVIHVLGVVTHRMPSSPQPPIVDVPAPCRPCRPCPPRAEPVSALPKVELKCSAVAFGP